MFECMCKTNGIRISKQDVQLSSKGKRWDYCVLQGGYQASAWIRKQVSENTAKQHFDVMIYGCLEMKGTFSFSKYSNEKNIYPLQYFFYKEEFKYKKC